MRKALAKESESPSSRCSSRRRFAEGSALPVSGVVGSGEASFIGDRPGTERVAAGSTASTAEHQRSASGPWTRQPGPAGGLVSKRPGSKESAATGSTRSTVRVSPPSRPERPRRGRPVAGSKPDLQRVRLGVVPVSEAQVDRQRLAAGDRGPGQLDRVAGEQLVRVHPHGDRDRVGQVPARSRSPARRPRAAGRRRRANARRPRRASGRAGGASGPRPRRRGRCGSGRVRRRRRRPDAADRSGPARRPAVPARWCSGAARPARPAPRRATPSVRASRGRSAARPSRPWARRPRLPPAVARARRSAGTEPQRQPEHRDPRGAEERLRAGGGSGAAQGFVRRDTWTGPTGRAGGGFSSSGDARCAARSSASAGCWLRFWPTGSSSGSMNTATFTRNALGANRSAAVRIALEIRCLTRAG